jgi:hypothetical protein
MLCMNMNEIVQQLRDERSKLEAAIQALEGVGGGSPTGKRRGRPPGSTNKAVASATVSVVAPKKRRMSAAARKRIGDAARARWAAVRKAGKKKL